MFWYSNIYIYEKLVFLKCGQAEDLEMRFLFSILDHVYYFHWETRTFKFSKTTLHILITQMMLNRSALKKILEGNSVA